MIRRVVKMHFRTKETESFEKIFADSRDKIRAFPGCSHLELWRSIQDPDIYFTHSTWESEEHLDDYRKSELFRNTWSSTKALFAERAEAWSVEVLFPG